MGTTISTLWFRRRLVLSSVQTVTKHTCRPEISRFIKTFAMGRYRSSILRIPWAGSDSERSLEVYNHEYTKHSKV